MYIACACEDDDSHECLKRQQRLGRSLDILGGICHCDCHSCPERPDYERLLLNLLAVIHRDGGRYVAANGIEKACADAAKTWCELQEAAERQT